MNKKWHWKNMESIFFIFQGTKETRNHIRCKERIWISRGKKICQNIMPHIILSSLKILPTGFCEYVTHNRNYYAIFIFFFHCQATNVDLGMLKGVMQIFFKHIFFFWFMIAIFLRTSNSTWKKLILQKIQIMPIYLPWWFIMWWNLKMMFKKCPYDMARSYLINFFLL